LINEYQFNNTLVKKRVSNQTNKLRIEQEKPVSLPVKVLQTFTMTKDTFYHLICRLIEEVEPGAASIFLESQLTGHPSSRYSIFAADPDVVIRAYGENVVLETGDAKDQFSHNPWQALQKVREEYPGWYFGYLGYDLKNYNESLTSQNRDYTGAPDLFFFKPATLLIYDQSEGRLIESKGMPGQTIESEYESPGKVDIKGLRSVTGSGQYLANIREAKKMIKEGEFYEINLSHMLQGTFTGSGFDLYRRMRSAGPVPFASFLRWDDYEVCCASPERFLCRQGGKIFSQPIKGTAARQKNPKKDEQTRKKLLQSEKDRAENLMIVDLVRHDLSQIALPGSVHVPKLFDLQSFETVHQLISTVEGKIHPQTDSVDILKACFPMGSMTGAPKISAMKAIETFEDYKRGIYSGAIGYISPNHDFDFNVVIRSAILKNGELYYPVGGAITSDSIPEDELQETFIKARALTNVVNLDYTLK